MTESMELKGKAQSDFIIEDGVLKKYRGEDPHVVIPEGVISIGDKAFCDNFDLRSITFPQSLISIGDSAFSACFDLRSITFPQSLTSIGNGAFWGCSSLTHLTLPHGLISIGDSAFWSCTSLTHITIPESVTSIGSWAFETCPDLRHIETQIRFDEKLYLKVFDSIFVFDNDFEIRPLVVNDLSMFPDSVKPAAAVGFAEEGADVTDERGKAHLKYIKNNAAKLMNEAFAHPALLWLMLENKLLKSEVVDKYLEAAQSMGKTEFIAALLDYKENSLTRREKAKAAKRAEDDFELIFDLEDTEET